jgi:hypothetical protein
VSIGAQVVPPFGTNPILDTKPATNVTSTDATLQGSFNPNGSAKVPDNLAFVYGLQNPPSIFTDKVVAGNPASASTNLNFTANISGLIPGSVYWFKSIGTNNGSMFEGPTLAFQGPYPVPSVTLDATPNFLLLPGSSTLSWTSANVSSCVATSDTGNPEWDSANKSLNSPTPNTPINVSASTLFTLSCNSQYPPYNVTARAGVQIGSIVVNGCPGLGVPPCPDPKKVLHWYEF